MSRDLSVESGLKVSEAGPGSVRALRPNSDFQYRSVLYIRSVGSVPRSNPASTRPGSITACNRNVMENVMGNTNFRIDRQVINHIWPNSDTDSTEELKNVDQSQLEY